MCNFTNRLFVLAAFSVALTHAWPTYLQHGHGQPQQQRSASDFSDLLGLFDEDTDYDLHYDQRQKGEENLRIKLDGFFIGVPPEEQSSLVLVTEDMNDYWETLLGSGKHQNAAADSKYQAALANYPNDVRKPQAVVVQIPAPKKEGDARQRSTQIVADDSIRSRTKFHMYNLLKLLKARKD